MDELRCRECSYRSRGFPFDLFRRGAVFLDDDWYCSYVCLEEALVTLAARSLAYPVPEVDYQHRVRIGSILVQKGLVRPEQLAAAIEKQSLEGGTIGSHILAMGFCTEEQLTAALSEQQGIPWTGDIRVRNLRSVVGYVPRRLCDEYSVFPFNFDENNQVLFLAARSPLKISFVHMLRKMAGCQVQALITTDAQFASKFESFQLDSPALKEVDLTCARDAGLIGRRLTEEVQRMKAGRLKVVAFDHGLWAKLMRRSASVSVVVMYEKRAKTAGSARQNLPSERRISM